MEGLISENSGITISLAIVILGVAVWQTKNYMTTREHAREIKELRERIRSQETQYSGISDRMARMETKLDLVLEEVKSHR